MISAAKLLYFIGLLALVFPASAKDDPLFPDNVEIDGQTFKKLGEHRYVYRLFFKLYEAALYVPQMSSAETVIKADGPFRLQFRYLRTIDKAIILDSADKMLRRNLSETEYAQISGRVDQINAAYKTVRDGDLSSLTYLPESGTTLRINGKPVTTIVGRDFADFYFRIWLGERPISQDLKAQLLGPMN